MAPPEITRQLLPDWYRMERETEKIIEKLTTGKELAYYLTNPDEFIRRLAIIRFSGLKLKDSINMLKEILDDQLESVENRELAAWAIKVTAAKWNLDLLINHELLGRFTGSEKYEQLYAIVYDDAPPPIRFNFAANPFCAELILETEDLRSIEGAYSKTDFNFRQWTKAVASGLWLNLKKMFSIKRKAHNSVRLRKVHNPVRSRRVHIPIRFKKRVVLIFIAVLYCLLTFTTYGRILTDKYLGIDFKLVQSGVVETVKQVTFYAWSEFKEVTGLLSLQKAETLQSEANPSPVPEKLKNFSVTAKNGLNMRKAPDAASEKISNSTLLYGSTVTYLSKSANDHSGRLWYYVKSPDGKTGWVFAKWLKEREG